MFSIVPSVKRIRVFAKLCRVRVSSVSRGTPYAETDRKQTLTKVTFVESKLSIKTRCKNDKLHAISLREDGVSFF